MWSERVECDGNIGGKDMELTRELGFEYSFF